MDQACKHGPDATYGKDGFCTKCGANLFPEQPPTQRAVVENRPRAMTKMECEVDKKLYADRDAMALGQRYIDHVSAMTTEGLHAKSDIAAELAWRDLQIDRVSDLLRRVVRAHVHIEGGMIPQHLLSEAVQLVGPIKGAV